MMSEKRDDLEWVSDTHFVCTLPSPAVKLSVENGCVIADLENGERFVVPVEGCTERAN